MNVTSEKIFAANAVVWLGQAADKCTRELPKLRERGEIIECIEALDRTINALVDLRVAEVKRAKLTPGDFAR